MLTTTSTKTGVTLIAFAMVLAGCTVERVTVVNVSSVEVSPASVRIEVGGQRQMSAEVLNEQGEPLQNIPVEWGSTAPSVASVDRNGLLVARAAGVVDVRATAAGVSGFAAVRVLEPQPDSVSP